MRGLIGHTGYVGTSLKRQAPFERCFASKDIATIEGGEFDLLVCSAAPAMKWVAERDPAADLANLEKIAGHLGKVRAKRVVLISTVDVFADSAGCDEGSEPGGDGLGAYGRNRLWLEQCLTERFDNVLVARLVGLVGPGLRKNAVFDLHNDNALEKIDSRGEFQFYPMVNLWTDLNRALDAGMTTVHLTAEPVSVAEVARQCFGREFENHLDKPVARYDLRTRHAALFGGSGDYTWSRRESLLAISAYAQSEPKSQAIA